MPNNIFSNFELIKILESATELFRNKKYYGKDYVEKYIGYNIHKSGFYGKQVNSKLVALDRSELIFDSPDNIEIVIEGFVELNRAPVNNGSGDIVYSGYGVLEVDKTVVHDGREGSSGIFENDISVVLPSGRSLGKYINGDTIASTGLTFEEVMNDIAQDYLVPEFSSFNIGQSSPIEVGTTISGNKTFTWGTTNPSNVQLNSIVIRDVTNAVDLGTGLVNDGSESLPIGSIQKNVETSHVWQVQLTDTNSGTDTWNDSVAWSYIQFYGPTSSIPTNSAEVRALPSTRFNSASSTFELNTGAVEVNYAVALPPSKSISQVIDLDALNADITSEYVSQGTTSVLDAGGSSVNYTLYVMTQAVPYSSNHRHRITLS